MLESFLGTRDILVNKTDNKQTKEVSNENKCCEEK